jgi:hypothetical protein
MSDLTHPDPNNEEEVRAALEAQVKNDPLFELAWTRELEMRLSELMASRRNPTGDKE